MTTYWQNPDTPSPPRNYYIIYRPLVPWGDTGAGSEVPDFDLLKANFNYKPKG
jgi:hypothetical protein